LETPGIVYHTRRIKLSIAIFTRKVDFQTTKTNYWVAQIFRFWWYQPSGSSIEDSKNCLKFHEKQDPSKTKKGIKWFL
jgi:hypothetical protein